MSSANFAQTTHEHHPEVISRVIAGEVLLIPIHNNTADMDYIYTLNETAARIWELTDGTRSTEEIALEMSREFETDSKQALIDCEDVLTSLLEIGAVRQVKTDL